MEFRNLNIHDTELLQRFYAELDSDAKTAFRPHAFDEATVRAILSDDSAFPFAAIDDTGQIVAYFFLRSDLTPNDKLRVGAAGVDLTTKRACSFAPAALSVIRGTGLAFAFFSWVEDQLRIQGVDVIVLQGGVKATNWRAIKFYQSVGFVSVGEFYRGAEVNHMMVKILHSQVVQE